MKTLRSLIGMPVLVGNRRIGRVVQAQLSGDLSRLGGVWVDAGMRGTRFIPAESLALIGSVAIVSDDAGARRRMQHTPLFRRAVGTDGRRLGAITGAEIDEISFRVESLELSQGIWDDLISGRARLTRFSLNRETGDVLIDADHGEKEGTDHEERHDAGIDHRRADRRFGGGDVRRDELADGEEDESADEKDRPLAVHQSR